MKLFTCPCCGQLLFFENTHCERCGHRLGYVPERNELTALEPESNGAWRSLSLAGGTFRFCANAEHDVCNWLVPADGSAAFCLACRHNRTIPDLSAPNAVFAWRNIENAKRWLFYSILRLGLPHPRFGEAPEPLVFDFLADPPDPSGPRVMTGHDNGVITIALAEADDAERERRRTLMGEPYRTLVGHFRHEVGHYYWDLLVRDGGHLEACRRVFGDDREDYAAALQRHHDDGPPADWQGRFISGYATTHPWEDFAETWAHYLHIVDAFEMAEACRIAVAPAADTSGVLAARADIDVYAELDIRAITDRWIALGFSLNAINRCMGQPDVYPFVLSPAVISKLGFVHRLVRGTL